MLGGQTASDQVGIEMPEIGGGIGIDRNGRDLEADSTGFRGSSPGKYGVLQ